MSDITLIARCHCSFASFTFTIPHSALPLKASVCHCNSCRHATGQIFATFVVMPPGTPRPDFSHLQSYASSANLTRYSCPKCGTYVGNVEPDEWEFASGMLSSTEGILDRVQMWIEDTKDGGASIWLKKGDGTNPIRRLRGRESVEATDAVIEEMAQKSREQISSTPVSSSSSGLNASCHCGGVKLSIRPPSEPSSSSEPEPESDNAKESTKKAPSSPPYPAILCACTSCRLTTGFEISSWIRVPQSHLYTTTTTTTTRYSISPTKPHLLPYASTPTPPKVHRYSCTTCGATAFYVNDKTGDSVDIAAGLLRAGSGCRAEEWVRWVRGPEFAEEAVDTGFVGAVVEGMRRAGLPEEEEEEEEEGGGGGKGGGVRVKVHTQIISSSESTYHI